jgi:hypothetical protein
MTAPAERLKEAHRGFRKAEPAARSRLAALDTFGLRYEHVDEFNVIVEGDYHLNLAMSFWRAIDGSMQGYLVSGLAREIRTNNPNPAGGRDSTEASEIPGKSTLPAVAESPAGTYSSVALMEAPAWP